MVLPGIVLTPPVIFTWIILSLATALSASAQDAAFEQANRLYEQGKYSEAATAYHRLLGTNATSATLYFNLGNAWFKAGQVGRALAAWRQAERIAPRDPDVRFNLEFGRKQVSGSSSLGSPKWKRWFSGLTLDAWSLAASAAFWLFFLLLAVRELRQSSRKMLTLPAALAAGLFLCFATASVLAYNQSRIITGVVIVPQGVVRYGPLEESQVHFQLRDGSEVTVLDEKPGPASQPPWVQIEDAARRRGWVKQDQILVLR